MTVIRICARLGVVAMVAFGASACSSIPDWVDPTTWLGADSGPSGVDAQNGESPDLASIPDRPDPSTTAEEQQRVSQSLAADRTRAKYSADALRGGTEPVAAPPPPPSAEAPAPPPEQTASTSGEINTAENAAPSSADNSIDTTMPPADATAAATPAASELPPAAPAPQMAQAPAPSPSAMPTEAQINPSDAALGFKPSSAPPLDPSIAQFVPPPIVARYNQTATQAGMQATRVASAAPAAAPALIHTRRSSGAAMGGPETMSGAVVANFDVLQQMPETTTQPSVYANPQGLPPASVVFFPGDGTLLSAEGKARVRAAVAEFKERGGQGYIRIVGHSSSRTTNMPVERHLEVIFNKSQDRANAVAKEVIRQGVPANRVLVEAVGDSQPVYYESMPKGEDGNRRAEIFLQS